VGYYPSTEELGNAVNAGNLDAALTIPADFARRRLRNETADIQVLIDAVNSNTAAIANAYVSQIVKSINEKGGDLVSQAASNRTSVAPPRPDVRQPVRTETFSIANQPSPTKENKFPALGSGIPMHIAFLFNPGLEHSWFVITGILGTIIVLNGSVVSSASIIKEREVGTIEQLLMSPATASEIIVAKMAALCILLLGQLALALGVGWLIFNIPTRGSLTLLFVGGMLCLMVGVALGLAIAAMTHNQQQAQLLAFFINPIIGILSGALTPIEAMPKWMQTASIFNPVRHFAVIVRGVLVKGVGVSELYPHFLALLAILIFLLTISMWRLRKRMR
jgi:ABC-2 type transport system permease protein